MGAFLALLFLSLWPVGAGAQPAAGPGASQEPFLFTADEVIHERELGISRLTGNVEISKDDKILIADTVTYNEREAVLSASGNVKFLQPSGDVLFGEFMEISGDFKDGIIREIRILLSDSARIAANGARLSGGTRLEMSNAVYSSCNACARDPEQPPFWQVKAVKAVHDQVRKTVEYTDAWLELAGLPVFYTPYLSHSDPTVQRQSGFLVPKFGASNNLGTTLSAPYHYVIAPNRDATITPILTSKERLVLAGEYRELQTHGLVNVEASVNYDSKNEFRGHLDSDGRFDLDRTWRWGFDLDRASDDTYKRRFRFGSEKTLTSRLFAEGFRNRNYMAVSGVTFQGVRETDDPGNTPVVLPMFEFSQLGEPLHLGARTSLDASMVALSRTRGMDTRRMSAGAGYHLPYISPLGEIYDLSLSLHGDLYHVSRLPRPGAKKDYSGFAGRLRPEMALNWRLPFSRRSGFADQVVEPVVSVVLSPNGGNPDTIPNEDSVDLELDETNLISANRFTGLDRVESGPRMGYGLKWRIQGKKGGGSSVFLGQSFRLRDDYTFGQGSGLEDNFSDIVGRLTVSPGEDLDLVYRTRIDKDDLSPRRHEVNLRAGRPALNFSTNYVFFDHQEGSEFGGREEIRTNVSAKLTRFWRSDFSNLYDLDEDDGLRSLGLKFTYECECFDFSVSFTRTFYEDRDVKPSDAILLRMTFKTLGEVQTGISHSGS